MGPSLNLQQPDVLVLPRPEEGLQMQMQECSMWSVHESDDDSFSTF